MLARTSFADRFGPRALFGMVHLLPLPGAPLYGGSLDAVIDAALADARAIVRGGADGIAAENFGDKPFRKSRVDPETVAAMTAVISEIRRAVNVPVGVNVLRNDAVSALAIAAATGAAFIRVNVHTGAVLADQGLIEGEAAETLRRRAAIAPEVLIFADHDVKHATPLAAHDPVQSAKDLRYRGLADALIVSGRETGAAADPARVELLRGALPDVPLIVGSGLTEENAKAFGEADAAIVGTWIKTDGRVDPARVERIVAAFK